MKLLSLKEASPVRQYPVSQELYARVQRDERRSGRTVSQEDIGKFAAWYDVQTNGMDKSDLPRILWDGLEGMKGNPQEVEKVFNYRVGDDSDTEEAIEELVDDFFAYSSGRKRR